MKIEAAIFDMDGVIIDSEPFWKKAEKKVFSSVGVTVSNELSKITESMTTSEVTRFWYEKQPWKKKTLEEVENEVVDYVEFLVEQEGIAIDGIKEVLEKLKKHDYKIGLPTNSPYRLIPAVLKKLNIVSYFDALASAEHEIQGKPDPAIYLTVAGKLNVKPERCIVFEDSYFGLMAAKRAGMKTIAVVAEHTANDMKYEIADARIDNFSQFDLSLLESLNAKWLKDSN
jgi:sugar-phosphatase